MGAQHKITAREWANRLAEPDAELRDTLTRTYGASRYLDRLPLLQSVVSRFLDRFDDAPIVLVRCPGRLNLRGMHVDTHGGYLNLLTHQREVVAAVALSHDDGVQFVNTDPRYPEVSFHLRELIELDAFRGDWQSFIESGPIRRRVQARPSHWQNYVEGALCRVFHRSSTEPRGFYGVLGSDLPVGAGLSSSMAITLALMIGAGDWLGKNWASGEMLRAGQNGEWYTGSRCGLSDQAAMVLGGQNELVNVALCPHDLDTAAARHIAVSDEIRVLVANSFTERSISGDQLVDYTRNRFAYAMALAIVRHELRGMGVPEPVVEACDRLAHLTPDRLGPHTEGQGMLGVIARVPEELSIDELRCRYDVPDLDEQYERHFGGVETARRPDRIALRGPLLFGVAESERARIFGECIERGDHAQAGRLMSMGHDGDRVRRPDGRLCSVDVSDAALRRAANEGTPVEMLSGAYGASSPALDWLVDQFFLAGALGASLTGAGLAGTVVALCDADRADMIKDQVRTAMAGDQFASLRGGALDVSQVAAGVVVNAAPAGLGLIE